MNRSLAQVNYSTALRAYDAAITKRYAEADAAAAAFAASAAEPISSSDQGQSPESASQAASAHAVGLRFFPLSRRRR
ncbi:hypothetical protein [Cryobacterium sp. AP23]